MIKHILDTLFAKFNLLNLQYIPLARMNEYIYTYIVNHAIFAIVCFCIGYDYMRHCCMCLINTEYDDKQYTRLLAIEKKIQMKRSNVYFNS